jgi:hypothetical protein
MTNGQVLAETIARCDAVLEEQLAATEILLIDQGATAEEIEAAIGRDGYMRAMLCASRNEQIAAVATWLAIGDGIALH